VSRQKRNQGAALDDIQSKITRAPQHYHAVADSWQAFIEAKPRPEVGIFPSLKAR
jgi:hypothetical protein